jgi:hypothetical protein
LDAICGVTEYQGALRRQVGVVAKLRSKMRVLAAMFVVRERRGLCFECVQGIRSSNKQENADLNGRSAS